MTRRNNSSDKNKKKNVDVSLPTLKNLNTSSLPDKSTSPLPLDENNSIDFEACLVSSYKETNFNPYRELIEIALYGEEEITRLRAIERLASFSENRAKHGVNSQPIIITQINPKDIEIPPDNFFGPKK